MGSPTGPRVGARRQRAPTTASGQPVYGPDGVERGRRWGAMAQIENVMLGIEGPVRGRSPGPVEPATCQERVDIREQWNSAQERDGECLQLDPNAVGPYEAFTTLKNRQVRTLRVQLEEVVGDPVAERGEDCIQRRRVDLPGLHEL